MSRDPVRYKSTTILYSLLFVIFLFWMIIGLNIVQYSVVAIGFTPLLWLGIGSITLLSMTPAVALLAWRIKMRTAFDEPHWNYRTREIELAEFKLMQKEYHASYSHLISRFDPRFFLFTVLAFILAIFLPLGYHIWSIDYLAITPLLFGFSTLTFGIVFFTFVLRLAPSEVTPHFSVLEFDSIEKYVSLLWATPGISWAGVQLVIGEASGYFTFQDIRVIGRLEAIESIAYIVLSEERPSRKLSVHAELIYEHGQEPLIIQSAESEEHQLASILNTLVAQVFKIYVEKKGHDPFVDEILAELGIDASEPQNE